MGRAGKGQRGPRSRRPAPSQEWVCGPLGVQGRVRSGGRSRDRVWAPALLPEGLETWAGPAPWGLSFLNSGREGTDVLWFYVHL